MNNFKDLIVWRKSRELVKFLYELTVKFPQEEKYGLVSQIRRSAISIPSNIAEGCGKSSSKEFTRFLEIANSSCYEIETQIIISTDLRFITDDDFISVNEKIQEIQKMLFALRKSVNKSKD